MYGDEDTDHKHSVAKCEAGQAAAGRLAAQKRNARDIQYWTGVGRYWEKQLKFATMRFS